MIPFYLITGFLGSGKTTFLKHILDTVGANRRIAIIQNEFAPTGIDGKLLKENSPDFDLIEINNGSVFCACLLSNFVGTLMKITEQYHPELIFLEASGLADPINIAEIVQGEDVRKRLRLQHSYCLIDAQNYFKGLKTLTRFQHQMTIADTLILNKVDLATPTEIKQIKEDVQAKNPHGRMVETTYGAYNFEDDFWEETAAVNFFPEVRPSGKRPDIGIAVLRNNEKLNTQQLELFLAKLKEHCIRAKGIVHLQSDETVSFQLTYTDHAIQAVRLIPGPNEIIAFGDITPVKLRNFFKEVL